MEKQLDKELFTLTIGKATAQLRVIYEKLDIKNIQLLDRFLIPKELQELLGKNCFNDRQNR